MAKVISLLRKMGLVHGGEDPAIEDASPVVKETAPAPGVGGGDSKTKAASKPRIVRLPSSTFDDAIAEEPDAVPLEFPFEEIYAKAGVEDPEHGFTVYKLMEMVEAEEMQSLEPAERARVITAMLNHLPGGGVEIGEIAHDAAQRDRALDGFEEFLGRRLADSMIEIEAENKTLQEEIDRVTATHREKISANEARLAEETRRFETWRKQKRAEEERLHRAIEPFVASSPITSEDHDG